MIAVATFFLCPLLLVSVSGNCLNPVACPCGTSNSSSIICGDKNPPGSDPCSLLSNCETCRDELDACLTCHPGFYGPTCAKKHRAIRRKRQVQIGDCPTIFKPDNGKMRCRDAPRRGYCRASCDSGYTFAKNESEREIILECRRGEWYPLTAFPTCVLGVVVADCGDPGTPVGGTRYPPRRPYPGVFEEDEQVAFGCSDPETVIQGESVLTCLKDGSWSAPLPECVPVNKDCEFPGVDPNGNVTVRGRGTPDEDASFPPGTRLVYSCHRGYRRAGPSSLTCRRSGEWSDPGHYPLCIDETGPEPTVFCPNLGPIHHGIATPQLSSQKAPNPDEWLPSGTVVEYKCRKGYTLQGSEAIECGDDGKWSARLPSCVEACGLRSTEVEGLVTHGEDTEKGEWPWMVSISIARNHTTHIVCGGALLDRRTVLTAAHCVVDEPYYLLHFGKFYRSTSLDDSKVQVRRSGRITIHPRYDPVTYNNDIALIRFSPNIRYDARILPVCLPTPESTRDNLKPGNNGIVTGWGRDENDLDPRSLMKAELPLQSQATCAASYSELFYDPSTMICAGFPQGRVSTCNGDSGSGLVFKDAHSEGRFVVEGLVSYNHRGSCGMPGRYTVYTRVSHFMDWIRRNAFEH